MSLSEELHRGVLPLWESQLDHPFVQGLADGTLDEERFRRWLMQDYRYLIEFARVFAWAATKADRLESMAWYASVLELTLSTEMELHRSYAARFGLSPADLEASPVWPTTRAYTDFLVRTAADGDVLDLLAAVLPCAWGYLFVGRRLARGERPRDDRYADWIEMYSSEEFAEATVRLRGEMDRLARNGLSEEKRRRLEGIFLTSSRYEWAFWEMCWNGEAWPPS